MSVSGVSGSGKSSLVSQVLVELVAERLGHVLQEDVDEADALQREGREKSGGRITAGMDFVKNLVVVDQKAIGRTPRSNLATYTGLFDNVRTLFASTKDAKARRYGAGRFSFNVAGGRCDNCKGEGFVMVELLFLPSVYSPCPVCHGSRYNAKTLEIRYRGKNIAEVLAMTVDDSYEFFAEEVTTRRALHVLREVGLGYLRLGQPATELSGGEAQRIKLARELSKRQTGRTLYILDEPTTGLHFDDVRKLLDVLQRLVSLGNTVLIIEHHLDVIKQADWIIDLGPEGGDGGGRIVAQGPPELVARTKKSYTGQALARVLGLSNNGHANAHNPIAK
jgi:excinuclease ABC subunit A